MPNGFLGVVQIHTLTSNVLEFQLLDILINNDLYHQISNSATLLDGITHSDGLHHCVLICISLRSNVVEHLCICLLAICISSFVKCLFKCLPILYLAVCVFLIDL